MFCLISLILISTGIVYYVATHNYSQTLTNTLQGNIQATQKNFVAFLDANVSEKLKLANFAAGNGELIAAIVAKDVSAVKNIAATMMRESKTNILTITDAQGVVLARAHADQANDSIAQQNSIAQALRGTANSGVNLGAVAPSIRATSPIRYNGEVIGTISMGDSLSSPHCLDVLSKVLGVQVTFFKDSTRVMTTIKNEQGKRIIGTALNNPTIENQVLNRGQIYFGESTIIGIEYLAAYWPAQTFDNKIAGMWFLGLPVTDILKLENEASMNTMIAGIITLCIMLIATAYIAFRFASPIKKITQYAAQVSEGKEAQPMNIHSNDEFQVLAESLMHMVQDLKEQSEWYQAILNCVPSPLAAMNVERQFTFVNSSLCQMLDKKPADLVGLPCHTWGASICRTENCAIECCERGIGEVIFEQPGLGHFKAMAARLVNPQGKHIGYVDMVFDRNQEVKLLQEAEHALVDGRHQAAYQLESIVNNVASASVHLTSQIDISAHGAETAAMRMTETATAMDEMNGTVLEVARNSNHSAELAESTKQKANEGASIAKKSEDTMIRLRDESLAVRVSMGELAEHAQSISAVMSVISDIADQTNLLALNAAIEAARAGEAGRGFAVVADEVRKLAEKTMTSTSDVSKAILAIQQSTEVNVRQIDATVKSIEEATGLAIASGESLSGILEMAEESADGIRAIATASEQQSATSDEIAQSISDVSNIVIETTAAMTEATQAVNLLSEQAKQLSELIEELKS